MPALDTLILTIVRNQIRVTQVALQSAHLSLDAFAKLLDMQTNEDGSQEEKEAPPVPIKSFSPEEGPVPEGAVHPDECPHPKSNRIPTKTMGHPNRFHCSLCGGSSEG